VKKLRLVVVNLTVRSISGGYQEYLNQFFSRLGDDSGIEAILFIAVPGVANRFAGCPKVEMLHLSPINAFLSSIASLRKAIRVFRPDLVFAPMEKRVRGYHGTPVVTMVQNMEPFAPLTRGNSVIWNMILKMMRRRAIAALRYSDHVIALSDFVKQEVMSIAGVEEQKITLIPHGAVSGEGVQAVRPELIGDGEMFIFTAGILSPARGIDDLIHAFIDLKKRGKLAGISLCIAGDKHKYNKGWVDALVRDIARAGMADTVKWLGFLNKAQMKWCFQNASVFVLTSKVESFCITAVEAMIYKAPVVSSSSPCLPETLGSYPVYYEPGNWAQLADKIENQLSPKRVLQGRPPENLVTWDENFARTMSLFRKLIN
jgi:glycosyltransferase involved in cell wall biosynthesis